MAANGNKILFELEVDKVKRAVEDFDFMTTDATRDKVIDQFYALMGSAQQYLKGLPEMQKRVVAKIDDYVVALNRWRELDRSIGKIEERMLRGIGEIETLLKIPESMQTTQAPMDPKKDEAVTNALNKVNQRMDQIEADAEAERKRKAEEEKAEAEAERRGPPWWLIPVGGAAAYYVVPKILERWI